ncbi:type II secretion system major pseudopilin GspG [Spongiibacter sp. KMU-158]|uniref:Type II secretion system major pseudopilin GspG n=1 Tax=Spongiibacter pelagi TaxID=2760804 RepID=A0A927C5Q3_9GAMM|nr:type II secretion system major pseudopilin GspG [Spongiibacter pelagi]MBD2859885.1 type II secretion system major pseudopilin GspG [Spongiibacter pelagi]
MRQAGLSRREILIIALVVCVGLYWYVIGLVPRLDEARDAKARQDLNRINLALQKYKLDNQHYPVQERGLNALFEVGPEDKPSWNGPYLARLKLIVDPWGRAYQYLLADDGLSVTVTSLGADGKAGGNDSNADILLRIHTPE